MFNLLSKLQFRKPNKERMNNIIALGKWRYVLTRGVFGFGFLLPAFRHAIKYWSGEPLYPEVIILSFLLFPLLGLGVGFIAWANFNRRYEKLMKVEG